jgi:hypothetical protein
MPPLITGLFGPGFWYRTGVDKKKLPAFALFHDEDGDWAVDDSGTREPEGFFVIDPADSKIGISDSVTSGLTITGIDGEGFILVEVP